MLCLKSRKSSLRSVLVVPLLIQKLYLFIFFAPIPLKILVSKSRWRWKKNRERERDGFPFIHEYELGAFKNGKDFPDMIFLCSKSAVSRKLFVINPMKAVSLCDGKMENGFQRKSG